MQNIPIIGFSAYSGTGKTTIIEKIILSLKAKDYKIAVIKHDAHDFDIDHEGKDSWRFSKAGADITLISSKNKTAIIEQRERTFEQNINSIKDVDLILVEGYKQENIPKIGIIRKQTNKGLPFETNKYIAIVTDDNSIKNHDKCFDLNDIESLTNFIIDFANL